MLWEYDPVEYAYNQDCAMALQADIKTLESEVIQALKNPFSSSDKIECLNNQILSAGKLYAQWLDYNQFCLSVIAERATQKNTT